MNTESSQRNSKQSWPAFVLLVRHGQSAGNVALEAAEALDQAVIEIEVRDVDVPLSELGVRQAEALGKWFESHSPSERPTLILTSTYARAKQTALALTKPLNLKPDSIIFDERLREREFGILDRLTKKGILENFPREAELHHHLKKFYYRPPGGESWCDVVLRLRSLISSLALEYPGERVLIVCHTVVILCFRYLFQKLTEDQVLQIDKMHKLANCSLTTYKIQGNAKGFTAELELFNFVASLEQAGEPVTTKSDLAVEDK